MEREQKSPQTYKGTPFTVSINDFCLETKNTADHDESPPRTPTGNAPSSESDIDISSPNVSHDESMAKDVSLKDSGSDLSHRPKRRRFHESYNFNMKCPTPGCNSLGQCGPATWPPAFSDCSSVSGIRSIPKCPVFCCDLASQTLHHYQSQWFIHLNTDISAFIHNKCGARKLTIM